MANTTQQKSLTPGLYPFWFWNDRITREELRWQIEQMAAQGIRGFFIHSRQGLQQPYMSSAFLDLVEFACDVAEEHDLTAHLYDEYPYPSGVAGGEVTLGNPQFQATGIEHVRIDCQGGEFRWELPRGQVLSCQAFPVDDKNIDWAQPINLIDDVGMVLNRESYAVAGLTAYNQKRYFASHPTPVLEAQLPECALRIYATVQVTVRKHKYWGEYVDVLNPSAIRRFIALTHERYRRRLSDRFGHGICSIFVDETRPTWSVELPARFRERYGYDLIERMPALADPSHPEHYRLLHDLHHLRYDWFCETFEAPISEWCQAHNLAYSGEKPSLRLAQARFMDIPGCEPGHTKAGDALDLLQPSIRGNAKATASAAYFYGKQGALCECYHSLGWAGNLQDAKLIADGLMVMGIRYLVPHGFFYSSHALKKHDAPPSFFFQMPFWPHLGQLATHIDEVNAAFGNSYVNAKILLVEPTPGIPSLTDLDAYVAMMEQLMAAQLDFLHVDVDVLKAGTIRGGQVHIRDIQADVVVVPPMQCPESTLSAWCDAFAAAGGIVVRFTTVAKIPAALAQVSAVVQPQLEMRAVDGDLARVYMASRVEGDRKLWFLVNTGAQAATIEFKRRDLTEIPLSAHPSSGWSGNADTPVRVLAPFEALLLEAGDDASLPERKPTLTLDLPETWQIHRQSPNLLRLYDWQMWLHDRPENRASVQAVPFSNQLDQSGLPLPPRIDQPLGSAADLQLAPVTVCYERRFHNAHAGHVDLLMEPGSLMGNWQIQINDKRTLVADDFRPTNTLVRGCLMADVTEALVAGENIIRVLAEVDRLDGGLRNPLYLAGEFGVLADSQIVAPIGSGKFEAHGENGLPYYAGVIEYHGIVKLGELPLADEVLLELPDSLSKDVCELSLNDGDWLPLPWSPRRTVVPSAMLKPGDNALRLRVFGTLIRAYEGVDV